MRVGAITESRPPPPRPPSRLHPEPVPWTTSSGGFPSCSPGRSVMPLSDCDAVVSALRRGGSGCCSTVQLFSCSACLRLGQSAGGPGPGPALGPGPRPLSDLFRRPRLGLHR